MTSAFLLASCEWFESGGSSGGSDNDGIPDEYEVDGVTYYGMDLYGMGARPEQDDLFIHVLTMDDVSDDGMKLQKAALDKVVDAFLEVGIHVHFDVGAVNCLYDGDDLVSDFSEYNLGSTVTHVVTEYDATSKPAISLSSSTNSGDDSKFLFVDELRDNDTYFPANATTIDGSAVNRNYAFYLLAFAGSQEEDGSGGSSGLAWVGGREFLVALGGWDLHFTPTTDESGIGITEDDLKNYVTNYQASTIMHEFGHNLGLLHGGDESTNYKPNYISVMNYLYQMEGIPDIGNSEGDRYYYGKLQYNDNYGYDYSNWLNLLDTSFFTNGYVYELEYAFKNGPFSNSFELSYSHGNGENLNESSLNEYNGLGQSNSFTVDFNGSGSISSGVSENINPWNDSSYSTLSDHDDWSNLEYYYNNYAAGGRSAVEEELEYIREDNNPRSMIELEF